MKKPLVLIGALVLGLGATVGDIGSCGETPAALDAGNFARARRTVDCRRCTDCALTTDRCKQACEADGGITETFPPNCEPLFHDGIVCLDALLSASCSDYAQYVSDSERLVPTECEFCRGEAGP